MAFIPDEIIFRQYAELSPAAIVLFNYYCAKRNRKTGGWNCPKELVLDEIKGFTSSSYFRAKHELTAKGWVAAEKDFIVPVMGFETLKNESSETPGTLKNESFEETETLKNESPTPKIESATLKNESFTYKEDRARILPAPNTSPNQTKTASAAKEKTSELPRDFSITEEMRRWANEKVPNVDLDEELEEFISFWCDIATKNNKRTAKGWVATWKNRMRELQKKSSPQAKQPKQSKNESDLLSPDYKMPPVRNSFQDLMDFYECGMWDATKENYERTKADFLASPNNQGFEFEVDEYERSNKFRQTFGQAEPGNAGAVINPSGREGRAPAANQMPVSP